jgi:hypothetical protein
VIFCQWKPLAEWERLEETFGWCGLREDPGIEW